MHVLLVRAWAVLFLTAVLSGVTLAATPSASNQATELSTAELVAQALQAELAGNNHERESLIAEAVRRAPNDPAARWHGGQVRFNGAWCSPAEVPELAKKDGRLVEYRQRRDAAGATVEEQAELARWCRRNKLDDEQRVHWLNVLSMQPNYPEAIKALKLQAYHGMLLPQEQLEQLKTQRQQAYKAAERWTNVVNQWRRAQTDAEGFDRESLVTQLRDITELAEMMGLEYAFWQRVALKCDKDTYHAMLTDLADILGGNRSHAASQFLARCAALGPTEEVRATAAAALKGRPLDDYIPILLAGLRSPVEVSLNFDLDGAGRLVIRLSYWYEGPLFDVSETLERASRPSHAPIVVGPPERRVAPLAASVQQNLAKSMVRAGLIAAQTRAQVERTNTEIHFLNGRIFPVLRETTGEAYGDRSRLWWDWWIQKHNEFDVSTANSDSESGSDYSRPHYEWKIAILTSCFARGTPVWTLTGLQPIEEIKVGDRVLSQDPESGELSYKSVLGVTYRAPGPRRQITAGGASIIATPGHPFWVSGQGWRMAKQLTAGEPLHSLDGAVKIDAVEKLEKPVVWHDGAYNLIVADFNTYFVGKRALLVHDNTPRQPTACLVPGLKRK